MHIGLISKFKIRYFIKVCTYLGDPIIWTFVKTALFILFDGCISYLLLKGFEIVPKVIKNPLLFGRITTYIFFILLTVEGFLMLVIKI